MNILVINLTRFGDLLQSAAAIRALGDHGGRKNHIGLICLENFASGAELLPDIAEIYPLPAAKIVTPLKTGTEGSADWLKGPGQLLLWADGVREHFKPDAVCNLSPTIAASLLARLLGEEEKSLGFALDAFGYSQTASLWASIVQGSSATRNASPFNIVDLFRKTARGDSVQSDASLLPVPEAAVSAMRERLYALAPECPAGFVALQLGASADCRRWPVASFSRVGDALWRRHRLLPVLLGTKGERPLAEEYGFLAAEPHANLMGETGPTELAAALTVSRLCISNDTGTLHLASGLNIPVLGIYLATAQPWDTGPYAAGNCSLEPDISCHPCNFGTVCENGFACHRVITPKNVLALASSRLFAGDWAAANVAAHAPVKGSRVWKSSRDPHGFADLISLSGHEASNRTQWMRLQRHLYRQFFDKKPGSPFTPAPPEAPFALEQEMKTSLARVCDESLAFYDTLIQQAEMLSQNPISLVKDRFGRTWQRLAALLRSQPNFAAIAFCWQAEAMRQPDLKNTLALLRQYRDFFLALNRNLS